MFRHNFIADLIDNIIVQTKVLYALVNQKNCVAHFIVNLALLQWSGLGPAILFGMLVFLCLRYAYKQHTLSLLFYPM